MTANEHHTIVDSVHSKVFILIVNEDHGIMKGLIVLFIEEPSDLIVKNEDYLVYNFK